MKHVKNDSLMKNTTPKTPIKLDSPQTSCIRCGICCKKGGPSIHTQDRELIDKGHLPVKYLFTIRKHEPAFDNIKNTIAPAKTDIVKIKKKENSHECVFYDILNSGCEIYDSRPIECRTLKCWNTKEILSLYDKDRIHRKELVHDVAELWNLIQDHQTRCSYQDIAKLAAQVKNTENSKEAIQKINAMIQYDNSLRDLIIEQKEGASELLEFLLGRPLTKTISLFGLTIKKNNGTHQ